MSNKEASGKMRKQRGRRRKYDPSIPGHIDQGLIPQGIYWHRGSRIWRIREGGTYRRVADARATNADLLRIAADGISRAERDLDWLLAQFRESAEYGRLKPRSKTNFDSLMNALANTTVKTGDLAGQRPLKYWTPGKAQAHIDEIARDRGPSAARATLSWLKRAWNWGASLDYCRTDVVSVLRKPVERAQAERREGARKRSVSDAAHQRFLDFAWRAGQLPSRTKGSTPIYVWLALEIAYLCRCRTIEVTFEDREGGGRRYLTQARELPEGLRIVRAKGSRNNIVAWSPRLRSAVDLAKQVRAERYRALSIPTPLNPEDCPLIVNDGGRPLTASALRSAFGRIRRRAIEEGIITKEESFSLHWMKHTGITNSPGSRTEKAEGAGHKSLQQNADYDHSEAVSKSTE